MTEHHPKLTEAESCILLDAFNCQMIKMVKVEEKIEKNGEKRCKAFWGKEKPDKINS